MSEPVFIMSPAPEKGRSDLHKLILLAGLGGIVYLFWKNDKDHKAAYTPAPEDTTTTRSY